MHTCDVSDQSLHLTWEMNLNKTLIALISLARHDIDAHQQDTETRNFSSKPLSE